MPVPTSSDPRPPRRTSDRVWVALALLVAAVGVCQAWPSRQSAVASRPGAHSREGGAIDRRSHHAPDRRAQAAREPERVLRP